MHWLVTGAKGMLGTDAREVLAARGHEVTGVDLPELDITDPTAVLDALTGYDAVLNCAAWTAVDDAETHEATAFAVNCLGPLNLARATARTGARLVHISTDYVFSGRADLPYREDDPPAPASAYGRTKLAGELAVAAADDAALVLRTAWLYGAHGPCFPQAIAARARATGAVQVVTDQVGQPTWTRDVADLAERAVVADLAPGIHHATASGACSWYDFARAIVAEAGIEAQVAPTTSADYPRPAPRPAWSVLGHDSLQAAGLEPIGDWRERWHEAAGAVVGRDGTAEGKASDAVGREGTTEEGNTP